MDKETIKLLSYVKLSKHRMSTLKILNDEILFPSEVGKKLKISPVNISRVLKGLENKGIIICLNLKKK
jgi:DNA-binding MarR family transcriptional regulator